MIDDMGSLLSGDALSTESQVLLIQWLVNNTTGNARLRAGVPPAWRVGDKTGTGGHGSINDIAIVWPPNRNPVLIAAYITETAASASQCDDGLAEVGRIITNELEDAS